MNKKRLISAALALAVALSLLPPLPGILGAGGVPVAQALSGSASYAPVESNILGKYWVALSADSAGETAAYAADGDLATAWAPEGDGPHTLTADLSGAYDAIRKTQIVFADATAANKYKIECSGDGADWVLLADRSANERAAGGFTDVFSSEGMRYLRLTVWGGAAVSELSAFNYLRADLKNGSDMSELGSENTYYYYYNRENNPPQPGVRGGRLSGDGAGPASDGDNIFGLAKDMGWSALRLRVWNEPRNERTGVPNLAATNCSPANTLKLAPYVTGAGLDLAIDFHYSDSWADPSKQTKPYAWADLPFDELVEAQHDFTLETIDALVEQGTAPTVVAIGNEVTEGMLWGVESGAAINGEQPGGKILWSYWHEDQVTPAQYQLYQESFDRFAALVDAGIKAVREVEQARGVRIATEIHIAFGSGDTGENLPRRLEFLRQLTRRLDAKGSSLDRVGVSYYPNWHGTWAMLERYLVEVHKEFPALAINISECSPRNSGSYSNDPNEPAGSVPSVQKQGDDFARIMQILNDTPDNIGAGVWSWAGAGTGQYGPVNFTTSGPQREPYASMKVFKDAFATGVVESGVYVTARQGSLPDLPAAVTELDVQTGATALVPVEWAPVNGEQLISASGYVVEGAAAAKGNMSAVRAYVSVIPNPPGDSAALAALAASVDGMAQNAALACTAESAALLGGALQNAQAALAAPDTAQVVIDARYGALISALDGLAPKQGYEPYSELLELLAGATKLNPARYTASSWAAVKSVADEAWAYIALNGAPQAEPLSIAAEAEAVAGAEAAAETVAEAAAQEAPAQEA
ncbi:MAG: glycosyl hydrolase 53 family protein, partial [Clostridiales bacterium]|nr:glycosyl hydrolase 53 family protein [Clostridiales bacterium]